jgi:hypothetical protein
MIVEPISEHEVATIIGKHDITEGCAYCVSLKGWGKLATHVVVPAFEEIVLANCEDVSTVSTDLEIGDQPIVETPVFSLY